MAAADNWLTILGFGAVAAFGYYLHTRGVFNDIFDAINKALDEIKAAKPFEKEEEKKKESKFTYIGNYGAHRAFVSTSY